MRQDEPELVAALGKFRCGAIDAATERLLRPRISLFPTHVEDVARAVELAIRWPGPGSAVMNVGTGKNHSVLDMLEAATKTAAALQFSGSSFTDFTPVVTHQEAHPADVPETLASLTAVGKELGWAPRILFPETGAADMEKV